MATKGFIPEKSGSKVPPEFAEKFGELQTKNYADQAKWFMNGFWESDNLEKEAESIWTFVQTFTKLDEKKGKQGNDLDEFNSHKFLETLGETMTVIQLRQKLREIDLDNNNRMSILEYLTYKYKKAVKEIVNAPQGSNPEKLKEAQRKVDAAQKSLVEMQQKLEEQKQAEAEARKTLEELNRQEKQLQDKKDELERKTKEGTIVQKNKAVQELAQLNNEDPLPLRKAKIDQGAAVRKLEKITKQVEELTSLAQKQFDEAQEYLNEVRQQGGGSCMGDIWWMQREITEAKKYLPQRKQ